MHEFDPELKNAMAEIREIAERYDIGIACALVSKTHSEYLSSFPLWSLIRYGMEKTVACDFKKKNFTGPEQQNAAIALSIHCLLQMRDICGKFFMEFQSIWENIEKRLPKGFIEHEPFANHAVRDPDYRGKH